MPSASFGARYSLTNPDVYINSKKKCDITHIHTVDLWNYFKMGRGVSVCYVHFLPDTLDGSIRLPKFAFNVFKKYVTKFYNKADYLVVVNPIFIDDLVNFGIDYSKIKYIPNYVSRVNFYKKDTDIRNKYGISKDKFVVLGVGQVQTRKGVLDFVEVAKKLPDIEFVWAGGFSFGAITDGHKELQKVMENPPKNVKFLGIVPRDKMNDIFKEELKEYIKQNFNYDPEFGKKSKEITRYGKEKKRFDSLHFPKSDEISNLFIYNSLKILNDIKPEKSNEKLFKLLSCAYLFFEDDSNFELAIDEIEYPFKFSKSIINCFQNKKDYVSFQIFNMALLLLKKIEDIYFKSMDFEMYNIIVLFEYLFIDMNTEKQLQIITAKIISTLFKEMLEFHIQNDFVANLNPFFFSEGKPSYTQFLKPKDSKKEFAKNTFLELEEMLLNIIKKNNDYFCGEISQNLFQKLNSVDRVLLIEEKNEKKMNEKNQLDVATNIYNKTDIKYELKTNNREKNISLNEGLIINKNLNILNEDNDNTNLINSVNLLNRQVTKLSKDNTNLSNKITKLSEDNTYLRNQITKLSEDNTNLRNQMTKLREDNSSLNNEVIKLKEDNNSLNTEVIKLKEDNSSLNTKVKNLNKRLDFLDKLVEQLLNEVNNLKIKVDNRDFTINQKEEEIKKQKDEIININKEKKEISKNLLI